MLLVISHIAVALVFLFIGSLVTNRIWSKTYATMTKSIGDPPNEISEDSIVQRLIERLGPTPGTINDIPIQDLEADREDTSDDS